MTIKLDKRKENAILLIIAACFFLVYLSLCFNNNVWTDEAFTIELLKSGYEGIVAGTAADVHPPLYYLIAKTFTLVLGDSLLVLKLISIVPMIICMSVIAFWIRREFGFYSAMLFSLFLGAIPCTMEYAVQPRMYSWALLFVTAMALSAYETVKDERIRIGYFVVTSLLGAAAAYTHYFAFVAILWIYGIWFLTLITVVIRGRHPKKKLCLWGTSAVLSVLVFLPWIPYMKIQVTGVSKSYWIEEITGETIKEFFPFLFGMGIPKTTGLWMVLIFAGLIMALVMIISGSTDRKKGIFAVLLCLLPVLTAVVGVVASALIRPIFIVRYLLPCMGVLALFLAITYGRYIRGWLCVSLIIMLLATTGVDIGVSIYREYTWTHTAETEAFLQEHVGKKDIIAYNYESYKLIYDYYWDDDHKVLWQDIDLDNTSYDTIWLLDTIYWPYPTNEYLHEHGWKKTFMGNFGIEHNEFKIYAITRE